MGRSEEISDKITPTQIAALRLLAERGTISPDDESLRRPDRRCRRFGLVRRQWAKGRMWAVITTKGLAVLREVNGRSLPPAPTTGDDPAHRETSV